MGNFVPPQTRKVVKHCSLGHCQESLGHPVVRPKEYPNLDHGYAVTSHSSQGQTADRVLIHIEDPTASLFMSVNMHPSGEGDGEVVGENTSMAYTVFRLSQILDRTVIDQTGLAGAYDFHVEAPDAKGADRTDATLEGLRALGFD